MANDLRKGECLSRFCLLSTVNQPGLLLEIEFFILPFGMAFAAGILLGFENVIGTQRFRMEPSGTVAGFALDILEFRG